MTLEQIRKRDHDLIKIGKIARVIKNPKDPTEFTKELYLVSGFQIDIYGKESFIVLQDKEHRTFIAHKDNVIIQEKLTIDNMYKPKRSVKNETI